MSFTLFAFLVAGVFSLAGRRKDTVPKETTGESPGASVPKSTPQAAPPAVGPVYAPEEPEPTMTSGPGRTVPPPAPTAPELHEADPVGMVCVWEIVPPANGIGFGTLQRRCFYPDP